MKMLLCLVLVLAVSSGAYALSGTVIENFNSYTVGTNLSAQGWSMTTFIPSGETEYVVQDAAVVNGIDGTVSIKDTASPPPAVWYYQGHSNATFTSPVPTGVSTSHLAMTLVPYKYDTTYGVQSSTGQPGPIIGGGLETTTNRCSFQVQGANWGTTYHTTQDVPAWDVIDLVLNMTTTAGGVTTGSLFYKDLSVVGDGWHATSIVDVDLTTYGWSGYYQRLYVRGAFYGEQDDLAYGAGWVDVPEPMTLCLLALGGLLLRKRS